VPGLATILLGRFVQWHWPSGQAVSQDRVFILKRSFRRMIACHTEGRIWVLALACLLVTACSAQWARPGATAESMAADLQACEGLALEQFPVDMTSTDDSNRKDYETRCTSYGHQTSCTTRSTDTGASNQTDRNLEKRRKAVDACMVARGYKRS
jgi:hypothetical protein